MIRTFSDHKTHENPVFVALHREIARIEGRAVALDERAPPALAFGDPEIDRHLPGGLPATALHEVHPDTAGDGLAAAGFALAFAARRPGPVLVVEDTLSVVERGALHGPGLLWLGLDPGRLLFVRARNAAALLAAVESGLEHRGLGAIVASLHGVARAYDRVASRRLALAAARAGTPVLLVRPGAMPAPGAAFTRWRVAALPSPAAGGFDGIGPPAFLAHLDRHRTLAPRSFPLVWSSHDRVFHPLPLPFDRLAGPLRGAPRPPPSGRRNAAA